MADRIPSVLRKLSVDGELLKAAGDPFAFSRVCFKERSVDYVERSMSYATREFSNVVQPGQSTEFKAIDVMDIL